MVRSEKMKQFKWLHFKQNRLDFKSIKPRFVSHLSVTNVCAEGCSP